MITITTAVPASFAYNDANAQPMVSYINNLAEKALINGSLPAVNPRQNAVTESTADFWQCTGADQLTTVTSGGSLSADIAFFAAHDLSGKTVTVLRWNGSAWVSVSSVVPASNAPFMIVFPSTSATGWGFSVSAAAQVGVAWIGPRLVIPGGVTPGYTPVWANRMVKKLGGGSRKGHWMGQRIEAVTAELRADFTPQEYSFITGALFPFIQHFENGSPFVWASAPSFFNRDCAYCWAEDEDKIDISILTGGDLCTMSMEMIAYAEP